MANDFNENIETLKDVFLGSTKGMAVLNVLLKDMGYFGVVDTEETRITRNYATKIVRALSDDNVDKAADALIGSLGKNRVVKKENTK